MKIAILADTHLGVRGDSPVFLDYFSRFFKEIFFPYIDRHNIKTVLHAGDLVDKRKHINFLTANIMRQVYIEPSQWRGLSTHIIAGNHDIYHKNHNEVNALREIVMGRPGFTIYYSPATLGLEDLQILMLPWISPENEQKSMEAIRNTTADYCLAHLELVGFEMAKGQMMEHGMDASLFKKFKAVYTGHYHHKSSKGNIHYLGSPYEMSWSDWDDPKGFHVLDTKTMELGFIHSPLTIYCKMHVGSNTLPSDLGQAAGKITKLIASDDVSKSVSFQQAVAELDKSALALQVISDHVEETKNLQLEISEDTLKILKDYVLSAEIDAEKDALIELFMELYEDTKS